MMVQLSIMEGRLTGVVEVPDNIGDKIYFPWLNKVKIYDNLGHVDFLEEPVPGQKQVVFTNTNRYVVINEEPILVYEMLGIQ